MSTVKPKKKPRRAMSAATKETPEVADAINEVILRYGQEGWFHDCYGCNDQAGQRVVVEVIDAFFVDAEVPTRIKDAFTVLVKVDGGIEVEPEPPWWRGYA